MVLLVPSLHAYTNIVNELRLCNNVTRMILLLILASQIVFFCHGTSKSSIMVACLQSTNAVCGCSLILIRKLKFEKKYWFYIKRCILVTYI